MATNDNTQALPIQPLTTGGWHLTLALYRAALAAGFSVTPIKEFEACDGIAWSTTLSLNKAKVIEVYQGGNGGPDELSCVYPKNPADTHKAREAAEAAQAKLLALPEAEAVIRAFDVSVVNYGPDKEKIAVETARIIAAPVRKDDEAAGYVISELATVKKMLPKLRKKAESKLIWAIGSFPDHTTLTAPDSPQNRKGAMLHHKAAFEGFQGFVVDLLAGL